MSLSKAAHPIVDDFLVHQDDQDYETSFPGQQLFFYAAPRLPLTSSRYGGPGYRASQPQTVREYTFIFFEQGQIPVDTLEE